MFRIGGYCNLFARSLIGSRQRRFEARYQLLAAAAKRCGFRVYNQNATWYEDPLFMEVLKAFPGRGGYTAKRYNLYYLARSVACLDGDTAECGVATGVTSHLILHATTGPGRVHHGFDSFEGLPAPGGHDKPEAHVSALSQGDFAVDVDQVRGHLSAFDHVRLYKGWIPDAFTEVVDRAFVFVHIDVDFYEPTMASLSFFYERTVPGGLLVCDDYGYRDTPGARQAVDEFFSDKPEQIIRLAAGHALVLKR